MDIFLPADGTAPPPSLLIPPSGSNQIQYCLVNSNLNADSRLPHILTSSCTFEDDAYLLLLKSIVPARDTSSFTW